MNKLFLDIIEKIKEIKHLHSDSQVAKMLNMTRNNLYSFKNRPNLPLKQLHAFCLQEGIRVDYLIHGKLPIYEMEAPLRIAESHAQYIPAVSESPPSGVGTLIDQAIEVLKSGTKYGSALKENIEAFHQAVKTTPPTYTLKKTDDPSSAASGGSGKAAQKKRAAN